MTTLNNRVEPCKEPLSEKYKQEKYDRMEKVLKTIRELEYKYAQAPNGLTTLIDDALRED